MYILVAYAINRNDQNGEHVTMHNTTIEFSGPSSNNYTAADVLTSFILTLKGENPEIDTSTITLVNYWPILEEE